MSSISNTLQDGQEERLEQPITGHTCGCVNAFWDRVEKNVNQSFNYSDLCQNKTLYKGSTRLKTEAAERDKDTSQQQFSKKIRIQQSLVKKMEA